MNKNEYNNFRIEEIKNMVKQKLDIIDNISDKVFKVLCLFSLVDSFAQEYGNYNKNMSLSFSNFIMNFTNEPLLNEIDPVTLFYKYRDKILDSDFNLNYLNDVIGNYPESDWKVISNLSKSKIIMQKCKKKGYETEPHKYINLIYKYRNKVAHEMSTPVTVFDSMNESLKPLYYPIISSFKQGDIGKINLVFPYKFLKLLFKEAIANYLEWCNTEIRDPFENSKEYFSWYE